MNVSVHRSFRHTLKRTRASALPVARKDMQMLHQQLGSASGSDRSNTNTYSAVNCDYGFSFVDWAQLSLELTGVTAATRVDSDRYEVVLSAARRAAATLRGDTGGDEKYDDAALGLGNERPPLLSLQPVGSTLGIFTSRTISQQRLWCACGALDQDNRLAGSTSFCSGKTQVLGASPWMPLQHDAAASRWAGQVLASPHMRVGQVPVVACRPSTSNQSTPAERAASELASLSQLAPAPAEPRWGLTNKSCAMSAGRQAAMGGALRTLERSPPASR
jgi:hypothetical protein